MYDSKLYFQELFPEGRIGRDVRKDHKNKAKQKNIKKFLSLPVFSLSISRSFLLPLSVSFSLRTNLHVAASKWTLSVLTGSSLFVLGWTWSSELQFYCPVTISLQV